MSATIPEIRESGVNFESNIGPHIITLHFNGFVSFDPELYEICCNVVPHEGFWVKSLAEFERAVMTLQAEFDDCT